MTGEAEAVDAMRAERDRYLAFAFAGADLLIELDAAGVVRFAAGALGLIWHSEATLAGRRFADLAAPAERAYAAALIADIGRNSRVRMRFLDLEGAGGEPVRFVVSACRLAEYQDRCFLALFRARADAAGADARSGVRDAASGALDADGFARLAGDKLRTLRALGEDAAMTLIELGGLAEIRCRAPGDDVQRLLAEAVARLRAGSVDGDAVGLIAPGKLAVIHDPDQATTEVEQWLAMRSRAVDPEGAGLAVDSATTRLEAVGVAGADAACALAYLLARFRANPGLPRLSTVGEAHAAMLEESLSRIADFRATVLAGGVALALQPVVRLADRSLDHYEALARFETGSASLAESLAFAADAGLIGELDYAVAGQAIDLVVAETRATVPAIAVNLSARSLANARFARSLINLVARHADAAASLSFEVTATGGLANAGVIAGVLHDLRGAGCRVGLDDFAAARADLDALGALGVDYVKVDGRRIERLLDGFEAPPFLDAITDRCRELGVAAAVKTVETDRLAAFLLAHGVVLAQGYLFGRPRPAGKVLHGLDAAIARSGERVRAAAAQR